MLTEIFALVLAAAPAPTAQVEAIGQALFDICPRTLAGSFSLGDSAQVASAGYETLPSRRTDTGSLQQIVRGSGSGRIMIAVPTGGPFPNCSVFFGGPENRALLRGVRRSARSHGYRDADRMRLDDGTSLQMFSHPGGQLGSLLVIENSEDESLQFSPITQIVMLSRTERAAAPAKP